MTDTPPPTDLEALAAELDEIRAGIAEELDGMTRGELRELVNGLVNGLVDLASELDETRDDRDRYLGHSRTLNTLAWRLGVALGLITEGDPAPCDLDELGDQAVEAIERSGELYSETAELRADRDAAGDALGFLLTGEHTGAADFDPTLVRIDRTDGRIRTVVLRAELAEPMRAGPDGAGSIATERRRQIEREGWTPEHDDEHKPGDLREAAGCYLDAARTLFGARNRVEAEENVTGGTASTRKFWEDPIGSLYGRRADGGVCLPSPSAYGWPWREADWKPSSDPRRNLVKAGALIAAEIDRLDRQEARG